MITLYHHPKTRFTNGTLEKGPYVLGEKFSAADVLIGTTFAMFMGTPMLPKTPLLEAYVQRVVGRPKSAVAAEKAASVAK